MNRILSRAPGFFLLLALAGGHQHAFAAPGEFDTSFGQGGMVVIPGQGFGSALFVTTDNAGRVLATGDNGNEFITRMLPNGSLDTTFNGTGTLSTPLSGEPFPGYGHRGLALLPGPDNSWLALRAEDWFCPAPVACEMGYLPRLLGRRINADGSIVPNFTPSVGNGQPSDAQISAGPGGRVFAISATRNMFFGGITSIVSGLGNAEQNSAFNAAMTGEFGCRQLPTLGGRSSRGHALPLADGRVLIAQGITLNPNPAASGQPPISNPNRVCVSRFNADGSRDASYGTGGDLLLDSLLFTSSANNVVALLLRANGGTALVLSKPFGNLNTTVIVWLTTDGQLDRVQMPQGITGPMSVHVGVPTAAIMQTDDKLVIAGFANLPQGTSNAGGSTTDFSQPRVMRLVPQGGFDIAFGPGQGFTTLSAGGKLLSPNHLHLAADGSIFVAGSTGPTGSKQFAVAKLQGRDAMQPPAGSDANGSAGGGCGITRDPRMDPMLPTLVMAALLALMPRRRRR